MIVSGVGTYGIATLSYDGLNHIFIDKYCEGKSKIKKNISKIFLAIGCAALGYVSMNKGGDDFEASQALGFIRQPEEVINPIYYIVSNLKILEPFKNYFASFSSGSVADVAANVRGGLGALSFYSGEKIHSFFRSLQEMPN